jgi:serine/threonine protein kinase
VLLGTVGHLAPEQIRGTAVDERTDPVALGLILIEMLTGKRAFVRAHAVETLHAILHDPVPDMGDLGSHAGEQLGAITRRVGCANLVQAARKYS